MILLEERTDLNDYEQGHPCRESLVVFDSVETGKVPTGTQKSAVLCKIWEPRRLIFIWCIRLSPGELPVDGFYAFGAYGTKASALKAAERRNLVIVAEESYRDKPDGAKEAVYEEVPKLPEIVEPLSNMGPRDSKGRFRKKGE